jgi:predicted HD phosphohydrolase
MRLRTLARKSVDAVLVPFHQWGHLSLGEEVSQLEHALQCAWFAQQDNAPRHIVVAALLHDIGHLVTYAETEAHPEYEEKNGYHEKVGASFLAPHFSDEIVKPVRLHVAAKRYQVSTQAAYRESLSEASYHSFVLQGGVMDASTCHAFESSPWFSDALLLRKYDELGKQVEIKDAGFNPLVLDDFYELLIEHTRIVKERATYA